MPEYRNRWREEAGLIEAFVELAREETRKGVILTCKAEKIPLLCQVWPCKMKVNQSLIMAMLNGIKCGLDYSSTPMVFIDMVCPSCYDEKNHI